ncbi:hypothetical protein Tco_0970677 [Tanacetum coccineum]
MKSETFVKSVHLLVVIQIMRRAFKDRLKVTEGGKNLRMKTCFISSLVFIVPDVVLPSHRLAVLKSVRGKTRSKMSSPDIPSVLNKLAISRALSICSIASSVSFPEKIFIERIDVMDKNRCSVFSVLKLPFRIGEKSKHLGAATPSHE